MNNTENTQKNNLNKNITKNRWKIGEKDCARSPKSHYRIFAQIQSTDF